MKYVTAGGVDIPALGLGTRGLQGVECVRAVTEALETGYRLVDTAERYGNQAAIGDAIEESPVGREELFLTTKVARSNAAFEDVLRSASESLTYLGVDTVDLLLLHEPSRAVPIEETIGAVNQLQSDGTVRHIGVSHFPPDRLLAAIDASETPILTDQVPYHPRTDRSALLSVCREHGIALTAACPLAGGEIASDPELAKIGERNRKTAAQVAVRWLLQQEEVVAIPKAADSDHLRENYRVFDFALTDGEMERIGALEPIAGADWF